MKHKLFFLFFIFISLLSKAQHYIVREAGDTIFCRINKVEGTTIFYTDSSNLTYIIGIEKVKSFSSPGNSNPLLVKKDSLTIIDLEKEVRNLHNEIGYIKNHLYNSHVTYRTGTTLIIIGGVISLASTTYAIFEAKKSKPELNLSFGASALGTVLSTIGFIIQIDSHKHIGKAGGFNP